jgi:tetratricopeptide (TPR) repeat protein
MKPLYVTSWLILALVAAPRASAADPDGKVGVAADASGRAHFQRGQRLSAQGDYAAAYREFEAGYAATGRPLFLFNMAEAARATGDVARARENYLAFLRVEPNSALAATAHARLADLDRAGGAAVITAPEGPRPDRLPLLPPSATNPTPAPAGRGEPLPAAPLATAARDDHTPMWKTWPFWAVVAGTVVAGGVIVYAVNRDTGACSADCSQINFR